MFGDRFLVCFFEELLRDQESELARILRFLELPSSGDERLPWENEYAQPRSHLAGRLLGSARVRSVTRVIVPDGLRGWGRRSMMRGGTKPTADRESQDRLRTEYRSDVVRLQEVLGRPVPQAVALRGSAPAPLSSP